MAHEDNPDYFSTTFSIEDEDHTLANSLRFFLNKKWVQESSKQACLLAAVEGRGAVLASISIIDCALPGPKGPVLPRLAHVGVSTPRGAFASGHHAMLPRGVQHA